MHACLLDTSEYLLKKRLRILANIFILDLRDWLGMWSYLLNCWTNQICYCKDVSHLSWECPWAHLFSPKVAKKSQTSFLQGPKASKKTNIIHTLICSGKHATLYEGLMGVYILPPSTNHQVSANTRIAYDSRILTP